MMVEDLPEVLVVQLNRFDPVNRARRSDAIVPLAAEIDLAEYQEPPAGEATDVSGTNSRNRLRAVVCHHGSSADLGHYTCWVQDRAAPGAGEDPAANTWTVYDDSKVRRVNTAEALPALGRDAYIVFYEQRGAAAAPASAPTAPAHNDGAEENGTAHAGEEDGPTIMEAESPPGGEQSAGTAPTLGGVIECDPPPRTGAPRRTADATTTLDETDRDVVMEDA